jgi:hypothetical protein
VVDFREKSYIISCEAKTAAITKHLNPDSIKYDESTVYGETDSIDIYAGETIELLAEAVEFKHLNDDLHYALGVAAKSPKIYVGPLQGFEIRTGISAHASISRARLLHQRE